MTKPQKRKLIYIPVIHSGSDMGSIAGDISKKGTSELGEEAWQAHVNTVERYWDLIADYCEKLTFDEKSLKIYQDGMVANGEIASKIIEDNLKMGSRNYRIISTLISKRAEIVKTEDFSLVKKELEIYKSISESDSLLKKLIKLLIIKRKRKALMKKRDAFIAESIEKTLLPGETGLLFLGAYHNILNKLPADIEVTQVKDISKVKMYQKLLPFQARHKSLFQKTADYLTEPLSLD
jgi:hypothetical protein